MWGAENIVRGGATTAGGAGVGGFGGSLLSALGDLLEPLSYPQKALFGIAGAVRDAATGEEGRPVTSATIAEGLGLGGNPLLSALVGIGTDPLTFAGAGIGAALGRGAGRQIAAADDLAAQVRPIRASFGALDDLSDDISRGVARQGDATAAAAAERAAAVGRYDDEVSQAQAAYRAAAEEAAARNAISMGGRAYQPDELRQLLDDPESPLVRAILAGEVPGVFAPRIGAKTADLAEGLGVFGYSTRLGPPEAGMRAVAYADNPFVRRRGSSLQRTGVELPDPAAIPHGPFRPLYDPVPTPPAPSIPPPPHVPDPVLSLGDAVLDDAARTGRTASGLSEALASLDPAAARDALLGMPVTQAAGMLEPRYAALREQAAGLARQRDDLSPFGRWFSGRFLGM